MSEPDGLLARADWVLNATEQERIDARVDIEDVIDDLAAALRAALAARPQPVTLDYDNGYKQGFRDGLRQQGHDVDRLVAEAVAGSATPTGDDDHE